MFFDIDPANGVPIYDQVVRQIKYAVAGGVLVTGDRVPSVRELAKELVINPNTIARSFQSLQQDGILEPMRGVGFLVAHGAKGECVRQRRELIRQRMMSGLKEAHQSGLNEDEIEKLFRQSWAAVKRGEKSA